MYHITKKEIVDSINIPLITLSKNVTLTHKVKLSRSNKDGERDYFHKEFLYGSKYKNTSTASTVRLTHSSILTIDNKNFEGPDSLIINIMNRDFIVSAMLKMKRIMMINDLFIEHEDRFIINPKLKNSSVIQFEPYRNKIVRMRPCLIVYDEDMSDPIEGVSIILDVKNPINTEIPLDVFIIMIREIRKFDFHIAGLTALTYLNTADIGKHEIDIRRESLMDFETELEPTYRRRNQTEDEQMSKLETKSKPASPASHKGWDI